MYHEMDVIRLRWFKSHDCKGLKSTMEQYKVHPRIVKHERCICIYLFDFMILWRLTHKSWLYNSTWIWFWTKKWEHLHAEVYERMKELQSKLQTFLSSVLTSSRTTNVHICNCHSQDVHFYYISLLKYLPKHHVFCCWFA